MKKPRRLCEGDRVHIVAPASPVRPEMFDAGAKALKQLGFRVTFADPFQKWRYLAGPDAHRKNEFAVALQDPEIRAIFFARGGYGSSRLLTAVNWLPDSDAKILHGCSDITSLHLFFQTQRDWIVFHGPMPSGDFARDQVHVESLQKALTQSSPYLLQPKGVRPVIPGSAEGILSGGCLTLLEASIGTPWEPDWRDSILFLEDVAVKPYQIDRMLTHLKIAGKFEGVRAFVFGEMKDCIQVENQGYTLEEVILDVLRELQVPVFYNFPSGHVSGLNWTMPLGVRARVVTPFELQILEGAVE